MYVKAIIANTLLITLKYECFKLLPSLVHFLYNSKIRYMQKYRVEKP